MEMKQAVLCFVVKGDKVLMINRNKPPFMGMWNAVGGKVEYGESTDSAAIREIFEESGIKVDSAKRFSVFTWNYDEQISSAYLSVLDDDFDISGFPKNTEEGIVDFKDISWVLNPKNYGVIEDLRIFIGDIEKGESNDYHLVYKDSKLIEYIKK